MAYSGEHLLYNHKSLSSNIQHPCQNLVYKMHLQSHSCWEAEPETGGSMEVADY